MSSSSSSGYSDEDTEASAPSAAAPPSASELGHAVELAQICSFCSTFRQPLRLPSFTRTVRRRLGRGGPTRPGGTCRSDPGPLRARGESRRRAQTRLDVRYTPVPSTLGICMQGPTFHPRTRKLTCMCQTCLCRYQELQEAILGASSGDTTHVSARTSPHTWQAGGGGSDDVVHAFVAL